MPLRYHVGQTFPDATLVDDREQAVSISTVAGGKPVILAFYRGPW